MEIAFLPFLSRKQLSFQEATAFAITIRSIASAVGTVSIRGFTKEGMFVFIHTPNSNKTAKTETFNLPDVPIMLTIDDSGKTFTNGECYIRAKLLLNGASVYHLAAGFVAGEHGLAWPKSQNDEAELTKGKIEKITSADPAAGAEISMTVPAGEQWKVKSLRASLTTDATVANRFPHFVFTIGGVKCFEVVAQNALTASDSMTYSLSALTHGVVYDGSNDAISGIPAEIILPPAATITTETLNIKAGDNWGTMVVLIEKSVIENV